MSSAYRVHVHDHADQGAWLACADFRRRPGRAEIAAAFPVLRVPGRYEVRINLVDGDGDELSGWSWLQDAAPERVIFRRWFRQQDGHGVIALFPDMGEPRGMVNSFEHIGQHGAADLGMVIARTRPASPDEYAELKRELERQPYGYRLAVIQRTPKAANRPYNIQGRSSRQ
jgi:hypothetical protein